jgi:hypothetical protein
MRMRTHDDSGGARAGTWNGFWRRKSQKAFNVIPPSVVLFGITADE